MDLKFFTSILTLGWKICLSLTDKKSSFRISCTVFFSPTILKTNGEFNRSNKFRISLAKVIKEILNSRNFCMDLYNENTHFFGRARLYLKFKIVNLV